MRRFRSFCLLDIATFACAAGAMALATATQVHPRRVAASPAANSAIANTNALELTFSETLVAQFSGMKLLTTDTPGIKMTAPMSVGARRKLPVATNSRRLGSMAPAGGVPFQISC